MKKRFLSILNFGDFWRKSVPRGPKHPGKSRDFSFKNPGILADLKSRDPGTPRIPLGPDGDPTNSIKSWWSLQFNSIMAIPPIQFNYGDQFNYGQLWRSHQKIWIHRNVQLCHCHILCFGKDLIMTMLKQYCWPVDVHGAWDKNLQNGLCPLGLEKLLQLSLVLLCHIHWGECDEVHICTQIIFVQFLNMYFSKYKIVFV